jgi:hypothetical protein
MDLDNLYNAIERESQAAENGDLSEERAAAIDAYYGRNTSPAPDGRSQVVDRTVYETIQWMLPSLSRIFANGDNVVDIPPIGPEDEKGAKQESQYLNYLALQKNNWFQVFTTGAKDALLTKTGYLYCYREKHRQVELEKYERQTQTGIALIMQDKPEVISVKEYQDEDSQPQPVIDPATGQPAIGPDGQPLTQPVMLYDIEIRRVKEEVSYCIEALPPERCKVSQRHNKVQLSGCPYFEYFDWVSLSDLRKDGYEIPDDVELGDDPYATSEDTARDQFNTSYEDDYLDSTRKRALTRYVWIQYDADDDGISELNFCVVVGKKVVYREECNEIPVGVLCPDPVPHRHIGLCPADTTADIQGIKTAVWRQGLDNLYLANNPRTFADPSMVNLDDLLVSRPGGIVRGKPGAVFGQSVAPFPMPFVFPQAVEALGFLEQVTEGRTGVNRYFQGTDQNALNQTAHGIQQLSSMAAQRVEEIARHFSNGIEHLFRVLHALVLKGGHRSESLKLGGEWVDIDPSTWRRRTDFRITVGYAAGNKDALISRLMMIASMQEKAAVGGLPIVQPKNFYETAIELTKASDFSLPDRFWTDPAQAPKQSPPQPDVTVMAAEQLKAQTAIQTKQADIEKEKVITAAEQQIKKYIADLQSQTQLELERMRSEHNAEIERFRVHSGNESKNLDTQHQFMLETHRSRLNATPALAASEQAQKVVDSASQKMTDDLHEALESVKGALEILVNSRKQIRRGKDGRAEGVDVLAPDGTLIASHSVQRGNDGRVIGT